MKRVCRTGDGLTHHQRYEAERHAYYLRNREKILARERNRRLAMGPEKLRAVRKAEYLKARNRYREYELKKKYGISLADLSRLLVGQEGKCAICQTTAPGGKGWCVDHDHVTTAIRGVLCQGCNTGIGLLKESDTILEAAQQYLRQPSPASEGWAVQ